MNEADAQSIRDAGRGHLLGAADGGSPPVTRADVTEDVRVDAAGTREDEWERHFRPHRFDGEDLDWSPGEFDPGEGDFID